MQDDDLWKPGAYQYSRRKTIAGSGSEMGKAHTIRGLVELRNKIADLSDEHAAGWPELERVLFVAELIVTQRIAESDSADTAPKERRC